MIRYIIDASVAIKWYLPEVHDLAARRFLAAPAHELMVPDLLFSECGNILWKCVRAGQMTETEAQALLQSLGNLPLTVVPSWPLTLLALEIACRTERTVYDSLYLALAVQEKTVMVTADEKFYDAIQQTPLEGSVLWVEADI